MKTEGTKHDTGKARYDLFPWDIMDGVIAVYTHGALEYQDNNWRKGFSWGRIIGAVFRHFVAWINGNDIDEKSGLHNLDQAVWNLLCLRWMQKHGKGTDDRWKNDIPVNPDYDFMTYSDLITAIKLTARRVCDDGYNAKPEFIAEIERMAQAANDKLKALGNTSGKP